MAYFPAFIKVEGCPFLVVGGGRAALRKIEILVEFGAEVTAVAPEFIEGILDMDVPNLKLVQREFEFCDLDGIDVVVAATNDKEKNHAIAEVCRERKILVNAVDQIEDCSFIFPSYVKQGNVVAAFSSGGKSPVVTQYLKEKNCEIMMPELAKLTDVLGNVRERVKMAIPDEKLRKEFYKKILETSLETGHVPSEKEITERELAP